MESLSKFKPILYILTIFLVSTIECNAQVFFKYNPSSTNQNSDTDLKRRIDSILNSNSIILSNFSVTGRNSNSNQDDASTLDIDYSNLAKLNTLENVESINIRSCIVRITNATTSINLNALNRFENLEIVHLIIETNTFTGDIPSMIIINNPNIIISYQISYPQ